MENSEKARSALMIVGHLEEMLNGQYPGDFRTIKAALEARIAKEPNYEGDGYADGKLVYDTWICPYCEKHYEVDYDDYKFCPECGQKIEWSAEN